MSENQEAVVTEPKVETPNALPGELQVETEKLDTDVTIEEAKLVLKRLKGITLKLGDVLFKVTYINEGQRRFTAEAINIKKASTNP